ncbi:hypothetical protein DM02DRAFT_34546 [Periconia macrospinosa]|uniref:Myb-like domain-containing protein n=1 Tax=Periconia macrospinosa TaxID=97972 RepID=A0A2V1E8Y4_9PLEO|nr:hypothetical protein DM02DRAFT_34546 [Periconia macrospinosa]
MAERRAVRSRSRHTTPTPQPAPQPAHASRKRVTRSASRDVELPVETERPTRRSARQASVTSITSENERENGAGRKIKRKPKEQVVADLTMVEEVDIEIEVQDAAQTPPRPVAQNSLPHRSPGGVSEISGTTAISSFSMVEHDLLDPRFLLRHLPKLHSVAEEFLDLLVPEEEDVLSMQDRIRRDMKRIQDMQKPDSELVEDYNDFDNQINLHLKHFRGTRQQFIDPRVIHQALFGPGNGNGARTGLDLILYRVNLLVLAKDMIHSDRNDKGMWITIRTLENMFPSLFLSVLDPNAAASESISGESALLRKTFELALDFRTQLAILYLDQQSRLENFDPDAVLDRVFFGKDGIEGNEASPFVTGWDVAALGGKDAPLPQAFKSHVVDRLNEIRNHFPTDTQALEHGIVVDLDSLGVAFEWRPVILRLLDWVRLRNAELRAAIKHYGGSKAIAKNVTLVSQNPGEAIELEKKRTSLDHKGRRRSRKFNPHDDLEKGSIEKLRATEQKSAHRVQIQNLNEEQQGQHRSKSLPPPKETQEVETRNLPSSTIEIEHQSAEVIAPVDDWNPPLDDDDPTQLGDIDEEPVPEPQPPRSTADIMKLLKQPKKIQKENRAKPSIFDSQPGGVRVEWDDDLEDDSQPVVASSSRPQVLQPSTQSNKRRLPEDSDDDEEAFETVRRTEKIEKRREKAKRVRLAVEPPTSSTVPTSHQPQRRENNSNVQIRNEVERRIPERDALERPSLVPPSSNYDLQREQARMNSRSNVPRRKPPNPWKDAEVDAFVEYMARFPQRYSDILAYDRSAGYQLLLNRDQVNLKDKARIIARTEIRSGSGLRPGFENVITKESKMGRDLLAEGYNW